MSKNAHYDVLIIGSGFGGSVSAMRLGQKGYKVGVVEMGKNYEDDDFPKTNWSVRKYLWAPIIRCFGIQKITVLNKVMVLHGTGVGGGSLVYANTLLKPDDSIFKQKGWPAVVDWASELEEPYQVAQKMLGSRPNIHLFDNENLIRTLGEKLNCSETFKATEVGVYFGDGQSPGEETDDPYFSGAGPKRTECTLCGGCMVGCRVGAKNTLVKNYLYFAKKWGVDVIPELKVIKVVPEAYGGYRLLTEKSTSWFKKKGPVLSADKVIFSAGVMGSMELLLKSKYIHGTLTGLSSRLGEVVRTNGESLLGSVAQGDKGGFDKGIAIGAQINPDSHTKIEGVRYPKGSDIMKFLAVPLTDKGGIIPRPLKMMINLVFKFPQYLKILFHKDWASNSIILLVMQSLESRMRLKLGRSPFGLFKKGLVGDFKGQEAPPSYIPMAQESAKMAGNEMNGIPMNIVFEAGLGIPATAHILGGAIIGESSKSGVVDCDHQVFGHPGLYVMDASVIPSNLAVNPSLTITALAERMCSKFPLKCSEEKYYSREIKFSI